MKGLENDKVIGRRCHREHPKGISNHACALAYFPGDGDVSKRHFRSKGPTRDDIAQLPVAHARTHGNLLRDHVTFGYLRNALIIDAFATNPLK